MDLHTYTNRGLDMLNVHTRLIFRDVFVCPFECVCAYVCYVNVWLLWHSSIDRTYMLME